MASCMCIKSPLNCSLNFYSLLCPLPHARWRVCTQPPSSGCHSPALPSPHATSTLPSLPAMTWLSTEERSRKDRSVTSGDTPTVCLWMSLHITGHSAAVYVCACCTFYIFLLHHTSKIQQRIYMYICDCSSTAWYTYTCTYSPSFYIFTTYFNISTY